MRACYLSAGLFGLAHLACAAPTYEPTAVQHVESTQLLPREGECSSEEPVKGGITICGNYMTTHLAPNVSLGACASLSEEFAYQVTGTVQAPDLMCKFYDDSDFCNTDFLIAVITHHAQIPAAIGKKIRYVSCDKVSERRDMGELEGSADDTPSVPDAKSTDQAEDISRPVSSSFTCGTPDKKHFLTVCGSSRRRAKVLPNEVLDSCVTLPDYVTYQVTSFVQRAGLMCKFYNDINECHGEIVYISKTLVKEGHFDVAKNYGTRIKYVFCYKGDSRKAVGKFEGRGGVASSGHEARGEDTSSAVAIDAPVDSAIEYATHMYANYIVSSIETTALDQCHKLPDQVNKKVTWIEQPQGYVCKYYRYDCQVINLLHTLDSRPAKSSSPIDTALGTQIEFATCNKSFDKRDLSRLSEDNKVPKKPTLEPGQLRIGENYDGHKFRKVINALVPCTIFPDRIFPNSTRFLEQSGRLECSFYKKDCTETPFLQTVNPYPIDWKFRSDFAQPINAANCTLFTGPIPPFNNQAIETETAGMRVRNTPLQVAEITDIIVTKGHSFSAQYLPKPLKVGDLFVCADDRASGCWYIHSLNKCVAFPPQVAYQVKLIRQAKGSLCKYYDKRGCMDGDEAFRHMSDPTEDTELTGPGIKMVAGVWCGGTGATALTPSAHDDGAIEAFTDVGPSINIDNANTPTKRDYPPGSTTVCHKPHHKSCTNNGINAIQQCANFAPADQNPVGLIQDAGAYCKWYSDFGCASGEDKWQPRSIDSRKGTQWIDWLSRNDKFKSVKCETYAW